MRSQVTYAEKQVWRDAAAMDDPKNHFLIKTSGGGQAGWQGEGESSGRSALVLQLTLKTNLKRMWFVFGLSIWQSVPLWQ